MQTAHAVGEVRRPQCECGHVELPVILAERDETSAVIGQRPPGALEVVLDAIEGKCVMAGCHRGMRREDRGLTHRSERIVETHASGDELVNPLQNDKCRVPFVQMPHRRRDAERAQRANAADAEDDFLLQPGLTIAAV